MVSRITQNILFSYIILILILICSLNSIKNFQKFFFYSEIIWVLLFMFLLNCETINSCNIALNNTFLILVFTAVESLIFAIIILLNSTKS